VWTNKPFEIYETRVCYESVERGENREYCSNGLGFQSLEVVVEVDPLIDLAGLLTSKEFLNEPLRLQIINFQLVESGGIEAHLLHIAILNICRKSVSI